MGHLSPLKQFCPLELGLGLNNELASCTQQPVETLLLYIFENLDLSLLNLFSRTITVKLYCCVVISLSYRINTV